jgi:hypothetical protein
MIAKIDCWLKTVIETATDIEYWKSLFGPVKYRVSGCCWKTTKGWFESEDKGTYQLVIEECVQCGKVEIYHNTLVAKHS